ncbi:MAG TPA: ankyrin repeat domain-containing protein [Vicinamibacterales bacterium]|jgi:ankyrin repeat protein
MRTGLSTLIVATVMAAGAFAADTVATKDTRLVQAAKAGNSAAAIALIQKRVDPNIAEPDGTTPLHWAVRNNDLALVDRLIKAGAHATTANRYGVTPIFLACQSSSGPVVERLLRAGVSANATGPEGETALHTCAHTGNVDGAKVLLAHGASINAGDSWRGQTPLMWAAAQRHPAMIKALVEAGADVNARSTIIAWERQRTAEPRDKWLPPGGLTAMLFAAREGCVDCVKALASSGADINAIDPDSHTPLVLALMNGHYDVAGALIAGGADINLADGVGRTPLLAAVDDHTMPASNRPAPRETDDTLTSLDIVKMLLARGANVNAALRAPIPYRTKLDRGGDGVLGAGTTALLRAAKAGDTPVIAMLLEKGANAKAATRNGVNGIMMAANLGTREEDMTGRSKTQKDAIETITLLLEAGTDVNGVDNQGRTAAHGAGLWGFTDVVKFLAANGAKLDIKDKRGLTALDTAMGLAGGFGFGGSASVVHEDTAKAIRELGGIAGTPIPAAPGGGRGGRGDRNQDDPQDGDRN